MSSSGDTNRHLPVYESTHHVVTLPETDDLAHAPAAVTREDIFPDGSGFVLHNLLSKSECEEIQRQAVGMGLSDSGYSHRIRVCDRVSAMGHKLAATIFERARPFLADMRVAGGQCCEGGLNPDSMADGHYVPYGLNPCFRIVRYTPGGFFLPHYDGGFRLSDARFSIKTFMIYLNGDFQGGPTSFFNEEQLHYEKPDKRHVVHEFQPRAGSCLVFNHNITHDGGRVTQGEKWLFRSEVMFERAA